MSTTPLPSIGPLGSVPPSALGAAPAADGFSRVLDAVLGNASRSDAAATQAIQDLATGEADDLHTVALAVAQADLSFRLALEIRNRLIEAYQEVARMQV
ncbi:MAG: flagellar hook-basal body complex protein FliE [Gemmataceae bacterium]|nr:flagellar hook-basal body complex protein FliE [Gemmataceae bacterium]